MMLRISHFHHQRYGGAFDCARYGGEDGFEFRITIESDGDIDTDAWTDICTTTTSTTATTTTLPECDAGYMLDIRANKCVNCPDGQYQANSNHQYVGKSLPRRCFCIQISTDDCVPLPPSTPPLSQNLASTSHADVSVCTLLSSTIASLHHCYQVRQVHQAHAML